MPRIYAKGGAAYGPESILRYGADRTGASDSTAAIEATLAAKGLAYAPKGKYLVNTSALPELGGKTLFGDGLGATTFVRNSLVGNMFTVSTPGATLRDFSIENLKHEPTSGSFVKIAAPSAEWSRTTVQNVRTNYAFNGIEVTNHEGEETVAVNLTGIWQNNYKGNALHCHNGANAVTLTNFVFLAETAPPGGFTPTAIRLEGFTPGCTFQNGEAAGGTYGLYAEGAGEKFKEEGPWACRFSNVYFDTNSGAGGAACHLTLCGQLQFANCWWSGSNEGGIALKQCALIHFSGGEFNNLKTYGALLTENLGDVTFDGTKFIVCGFVSGYALEIAANTNFWMATDCTWRENGNIPGLTGGAVKIGTGCNVGKITGIFESNAGGIVNESPTATDIQAEEQFVVLPPTITKTAGTLVSGQTGSVRETFIAYYAKKELKLKKVKHNLGTEKVKPPLAWAWKEEKWVPFAVTAYKAESLTELELEWTVEPYGEVAAKAPSAVVAGTLSETLSTVANITSFKVNALTYAIPKGESITLREGAHSQVFVTSAEAPAGATEVKVNSLKPNFAYPETTTKVEESETIKGSSVIYMLGSEAAGFINGRIAEFTAKAGGLEPFESGVPYYIVGAFKDGFELAATFGGTPIKVTVSTISPANTKIKVLAEEIQIAVSA